jgi:hypothetical protein
MQKELKNKNHFPHVYLLHDLDVPDAKTIRSVRDMAEAQDGLADR